MVKTVKRVLLMLVAFSLLLFLVACDYSYYLYRVPEGKEAISIELINYHNLEAKDNPMGYYPLDLGKIEILETLDFSMFDGFLGGLRSIIEPIAGKYTQSVFFHDGIGVKITYKDESFAVITLKSIDGKDYFYEGDYDSSLNTIQAKDIPAYPNMVEDFKVLINKYFERQIEWSE
jgi:hypothetical protein